MSIAKAFNNHFKDFLDDVMVVLPNIKTLKTAKLYINNVLSLNPLILVKAWYIYCVTPYSSQIEKGDFSFFINKDYKRDVGISAQYNSQNVLDAIETIRKQAASLSKENQDKIIKYVQNLSKLSIMYNSK